MTTNIRPAPRTRLFLPKGLKRMQWSSALSASILILVFAFQSSFATQPVQVLLEHAVNDDVFYYLEVAQRAAHGQGFTFDGHVRTNGFQPAWQLVLTGLATSLPDKEAFLRAVLLACSLLNLCSGVLLYHIWASYWPVRWAPLVLTFWTSIQFNPSLSMSGMETSLNTVGFLLVLWYALKLAGRAHPKPLRSVATLGVLCGLHVLARIDNLVFSAAIAVAALIPAHGERFNWRDHWRPTVARLAVVAAALGAIVGPYLLWNVVSFDTLLPVSGIFKQRYNELLVVQRLGGYWSPGFWSYVASRLGEKMLWTWATTWYVFGAGEPVWIARPGQVLSISAMVIMAHAVGYFAGPTVARRLSLAPPKRAPANSAMPGTQMRGKGSLTYLLSHEHLPVLLWSMLLLVPFWALYGFAGRYLGGLRAVEVAAKLGLVVAAMLLAVLTGVATKPHRMSAEAVASRHRHLAAALLVATLAHGVAIIGVADYFLDYTSWYFANWFVLFTLFLSWALYQFGRRMLAGVVRTVYASLLIASAAVAILATAFTAFTRIQRPLADPPSQLVAAYQIALSLDENLPPSTRLASYNAGVIGYFSNRPTTNLDGLVNNQSLMPYLFGPRVMTDYLDVACPDYLIDHVEGAYSIGALPEGKRILKIDRDRLEPVAWVSTRGWLDAPQTFIVFRVVKASSCP
jgi:hypothetical protein